MRISRKLAPHLHRVIIVIPMTLVMSLAGTLAEVGFVNGWFSLFIRGALAAFPVAYLAAMIVIPLAAKIIAKIPFKD